MSHWQNVVLDNVTTKIGDGLHGTPSYDERGDFSFINGNNLLKGKVVVKADTKKINESEYLKICKPLDESTILVSINGTIGNVAKYNGERCALGKSACYINLNTSLVLRDYFYYECLSENFQSYLLNVATGTTIPNVPLKGIRSYEFLLPPLPEQKAIASVLSSLDDKIDLLHRQNKTLEAMAETQFRQWFIEEARENWEDEVISNLIEVRDGTHDSPKQAPIGFPLVTSKHLDNGKLDFESCYLISETDYKKVNSRSQVETFDILISMIGTLGRTYIEFNSVNYAIKNIGLFKTSKNTQWKYFIYLWLNSSLGRQFVDEHKSGSTQEYLSLGSLRSIQFKKPPIEILNRFNAIVDNIFQKTHANIKQMQILEQLRDTLLPKLMSGEVRVQYQTQEVA